MSVQLKKRHNCDCDLATMKKLSIILISMTLILSVNSINEINENRADQSAGPRPTNPAQYPRRYPVRRIGARIYPQIPRFNPNNFINPAWQPDWRNNRYEHQFPPLHAENRNNKRPRGGMPTNPHLNYQGNSQPSTVTGPHGDSYANRLRQPIPKRNTVPNNVYNQQAVYDQNFPPLGQRNKKSKPNEVPLPQNTDHQLNRQIAPDNSGPDTANTYANQIRKPVPRKSQNINRIPPLLNYGMHRRPHFPMPHNRQFNPWIPHGHPVPLQFYSYGWQPHQFQHPPFQYTFIHHVQPALRPAMNNHEISQVSGPTVQSDMSNNQQEHHLQPSGAPDPIARPTEEQIRDYQSTPVPNNNAINMPKTEPSINDDLERILQDSMQMDTPNVHKSSHHSQSIPVVPFDMKNLEMTIDMASQPVFYTDIAKIWHDSKPISNSYDPGMAHFGMNNDQREFANEDLLNGLYNAKRVRNQQIVGRSVNRHHYLLPLEFRQGIHPSFNDQSQINIDDSRIVYLYDRQTTLRKLFGAQQLQQLDITYTSGQPLRIVDFSLTNSDLKSLCGGKPYINRRFLHPSARKIRIGPEIDTPTVIAENLRRGIKNFVVLDGHFGTGKSVSLVKILHELRQNSPDPRWSVIIDFAVLANSDINHPAEIFGDSMNSEQGAFFQKIVDLKPDKVDVLIDNIVKIPFERRNKILQYLAVLNKRGVGIVIAGSPGLEWPAITVPVTLMQVPLPTSVEAQMFLKNHWLRGNEPQPDLLTDYAKTLTKTLIETPIPRDFKTLMQLADMFYNRNSKVFGHNRANFQSVRDYLQNNVRDTIGLTRSLQTLELNKYNLYEALLDAYVNLDHSHFYSYLRLKKVMLEWANTYQTINSPTFINAWPIGPITNQHEQTVHYDTFRGLCMQAQYDAFIVARLIMERLAAKDDNMVRLTEILMQHKDFSYLIEFFNSKIMKEELFKAVITNIAQSTESWNRAMDVAISHGFDNIALLLIRSVKDPQVVRNYFLDVTGSRFRLSSKAKYRLGVMIRGDELIHSRQKMLFKMNMMYTIIEITNMDSNLNIWISDLFTDYFGKFFEFEKRPQLKLFELLKTHYLSKVVGKPAVQTEFCNRLMYEAIKHDGLQNPKILQQLLKLGIDPKAIEVNGETLIHIAVKAMNPRLLHYLMNDLQISITDTTSQSLLITALDANPLPYYSSQNFWRIMLELIKSGNIRVPQPFDQAIDRRNVMPSESDRRTLPYQLLIGADDHQLIFQAVQLFEGLPNPLQHLSPELLSYRRNLVLSRSHEISTADEMADDATTLAEVVLKYRGLDLLNFEELHAYQESFRSSLQYTDQFTDKQARRIGQLLFDNLGTGADRQFSKMALEWMRNKMNENVWEEIHQKLLAEPKIEFHDGLALNILERGMMRSRMGYFSNIADAHLALGPSEPQVSFQGSPCGNSRRRRRSVCHISQDEYNELVRKADQGERRIVDVDKFMDLMDIARLDNAEKYDQLVRLGRRLLQQESLEPIGRDVDLFMELVLFQGQIDLPELADNRPSETQSISELGTPYVRDHSIDPAVGNSVGKIDNLEFGKLNSRFDEMHLPETFKPNPVHNTDIGSQDMFRNNFDQIRLYGSHDLYRPIEPKISINPYSYHEAIVKPYIPKLPVIPELRFTPKIVPRMITARG